MFGTCPRVLHVHVQPLLTKPLFSNQPSGRYYLFVWRSRNMVKINTETEQFKKQFLSSQSKMSVFIRFLVKISFLPVKMEENGKIRFKLISNRALIYLLFYCGLYILITLISTMFNFDQNFLKKIHQQNILETLSVSSIGVCGFSMMFPLLLARSLNNLDTRLVFHDRLPFPRHGLKILISYFCLLTGSFTAMVCYLIHFGMENVVRTALSTFPRQYYVFPQGSNYIIQSLLSRD